MDATVSIDTAGRAGSPKVPNNEANQEKPLSATTQKQENNQILNESLESPEKGSNEEDQLSSSPNNDSPRKIISRRQRKAKYQVPPMPPSQCTNPISPLMPGMATSHTLTKILSFKVAPLGATSGQTAQQSMTMVASDSIPSKKLVVLPSSQVTQPNPAAPLQMPCTAVRPSQRVVRLPQGKVVLPEQKEAIVRPNIIRPNNVKLLNLSPKTSNALLARHPEALLTIPQYPRTVLTFPEQPQHQTKVIISSSQEPKTILTSIQQPQAIFTSPQQSKPILTSLQQSPQQTIASISSPQHSKTILMAPHQPKTMLISPQSPKPILISPQQPGKPMIISPQQHKTLLTVPQQSPHLLMSPQHPEGILPSSQQIQPILTSMKQPKSILSSSKLPKVIFSPPHVASKAMVNLTPQLMQEERSNRFSVKNKNPLYAISSELKAKEINTLETNLQDNSLAQADSKIPEFLPSKVTCNMDSQSIHTKGNFSKDETSPSKDTLVCQEEIPLSPTELPSNDKNVITSSLKQDMSKSFLQSEHTAITSFKTETKDIKTEIITLKSETTPASLFGEIKDNLKQEIVDEIKTEYQSSMESTTKEDVDSVTTTAKAIFNQTTNQNINITSAHIKDIITAIPQSPKKASNPAIPASPRKDNSTARKIQDDDILSCDGCGCHGLAGEFVAKNSCSHQCSTQIERRARDKQRKERELHLLRMKREEKRNNALNQGKKKIDIPNSPKANKLVKSSNYNHEYPWDDPKKGFIWSRYLAWVGGKSAPVRLFKGEAFPNPHGYEVGHKMESIDPENQHLICVVSVKEVQGPRLRIHFDGFGDEHDFWENAQSENLFPAGWCDKHGQGLTPPKDYKMDNFSWTSYLKMTDSVAAPESLFTGQTSAAQQTKAAAVLGWKIGMKLEAVDKSDRSLICVASVANIIEGRVLVHLDGWDKRHEYWTSPGGPYVHPVGWCAKNNRTLLTPKVPGDMMFSWESYLALTNSKKVPDWAFNSYSQEETEFRVGMRLEAVDMRNPRLVRVARVSGVEERQIKINYEGWSDKFDLWVDDEDPGLHPSGWCAKTGHWLMPPVTKEEIVYFSKQGGCPIPGCQGIGDVMGAKHLRHSVASHCPYSDENIETGSKIPDRLPREKEEKDDKETAKTEDRTKTQQKEDIKKTKKNKGEERNKTTMKKDDPNSDVGLGRGNRKRQRKRFFDEDASKKKRVETAHLEKIPLSADNLLHQKQETESTITSSSLISTARAGGLPEGRESPEQKRKSSPTPVKKQVLSSISTRKGNSEVNSDTSRRKTINLEKLKNINQVKKTRSSASRSVSVSSSKSSALSSKSTTPEPTKENESSLSSRRSKRKFLEIEKPQDSSAERETPIDAHSRMASPAQQVKISRMVTRRSSRESPLPDWKPTPSRLVPKKKNKIFTKDIKSAQEQTKKEEINSETTEPAPLSNEDESLSIRGERRKKRKRKEYFTVNKKLSGCPKQKPEFKSLDIEGEAASTNQLPHIGLPSNQISSVSKSSNSSPEELVHDKPPEQRSKSPTRKTISLSGTISVKSSRSNSPVDSIGQSGSLASINHTDSAPSSYCPSQISEDCQSYPAQSRVSSAVKDLRFLPIGVQEWADQIRKTVFQPGYLPDGRPEGSLPPDWFRNTRNLLGGRPFPKETEVKKWSVEEVVGLLRHIDGNLDIEFTEKQFRDQDIDGETLLQLTRKDMTGFLQLKQGHAVKIYNVGLAIKLGDCYNGSG